MNFLIMLKKTNQKMKNKETTHEILHAGVYLSVTGVYYNGFLGNHEQPSEPREFEIQKIMLNDTDVTELIENDMAFIEEKIIENFYS